MMMLLFALCRVTSRQSTAGRGGTHTHTNTSGLCLPVCPCANSKLPPSEYGVGLSQQRRPPSLDAQGWREETGPEEVEEEGEKEGEGAPVVNFPARADVHDATPSFLRVLGRRESEAHS